MSAFTEANRKAFDDLSATYNTKPWQITLSNQVAEALQSRKDWLGAQWINPKEPVGKRDVRLLDYACGTGSITKALGPYVNTIRGIDISEKMVQQYNDTARSSGLTEENAHAVVGDLLEQYVPADLKGNEWYEFDIAAIGLGFHHFEYPELALKRLAERLKASTGVLIIIDFLPFHEKKDHDASGHGGSFPDMKHTIKHNGFEPEALRDMYVAAGFEDFEMVALKQPAVMELPSGTVKRTLFIARARKSATAWQKLSTWLGGLQDMAAQGMKPVNDSHHWEPGFRKEGPGEETVVWSAGKQKDEDYDMFKQNARKKAWNGF